MADSDNIWSQPVQPTSKIMNDRGCLKDFPALSGIYKIINLKTGDFYVGSTKNFKQRAGQHYNVLIKNCHHNQYLQNSWNKYGKDNFLFEVVDILKSGEDILKIFEREQYYIINEKPKFNLSSSVLINEGGFRRKKTEHRGEKHYAYGKPELTNNRKLNWEKVREIRKLFKDGEKIKNLAKKFSISRAQINVIVRNISWKDPEYGKINEIIHMTEYKTRIDEIRKDWLSGSSRDELYEKYDICNATLSKIINNRVWYDEVYKNTRFEKSTPKVRLGVTKEISEEIRRNFTALEPNYSELSEKYKISIFRIKKILSNKTWISKDYIPQEIPTPERYKTPTLEKIRDDILLGLFREDLYEKYKTNLRTRSTNRIARAIIKTEKEYGVKCISKIEKQEEIFSEIYLKYKEGYSINKLSQIYNFPRTSLTRRLKLENKKNV